MLRAERAGVLRRILSLIRPHRRTFVAVVLISLTSTGLTLLEPLIYREAINDVAGLFVQKAKDDTRRQLGVPDVIGDPVAAILENGLADRESVPAPDILDHHRPHRQREAHGKGHVAGRTPQEAVYTLIVAVSLLLLINIAYYLVWWWGDNMNVRLACRIERRFISSTFSHVLKLPLGFFARRSSAAIVKQIDQSEAVTGIVNGFSQTILPEAISLTGALIIMFSQNVALSLLAIAIIPLYVWVAVRSVKGVDAGLARYYERWEEVSARMQDAIHGIKTVKLSGAEAREVRDFTQVADEAYAEYIARNQRANRFAVIEGVLTHGAKTLVLGYGGYLTLHHKLTPGDVVMFMAYLDMLYDPVDNLSQLWKDLQNNASSLGRAFRLLGNEPEERSGEPLVVSQGRVEFREVSFAYGAQRTVLNGLSFIANPGQITAIVGTSGAGKTTTVDLLMKLYEPSHGEILIDGTSISAASPASVRAQIGMVAADGALFRGTLANNIRYKRPSATDEDVRRAAEAAGMHAMLERLPEELNTLVGESGIGLSVGERQRVQIARMLVANTRILILDEATANLDHATEMEIKRAIDAVRAQTTIIVIAHRYSMVRDADHVIVLDAGNIVEQGTPEALIAQGKWFAAFANAALDLSTPESDEDTPDAIEDEAEADEDSEEVDDEEDAAETNSRP